MEPCPHLFEPYDFGFLTLPNRLVMGAMHTRLEMLDRPEARLEAFFRERARGGVGLILTGGVAPDAAGRMEEGAPVLSGPEHLGAHRRVARAVHEEGGRIVLQILHAGRYGRHEACVGPTAVRAPINRHVPKALAAGEVWDTIAAIAATAALAREAGYDGVELMGSEGYLLNEFTSPATNHRQDEFGGDLEGRLRLPLEAVRAVRARVGEDFLLIYRMSAVDLVAGGSTGDETVEIARRLERAGVHLLNTGIGWHESVIPTIAAAVPRGAWRFAVEPIKRAVGIPVMVSNRINTPALAEQLLADGAADFIAMARPLLADPDFARKARQGRSASITPCIACNQSCLDPIFSGASASCLVNPRAGRELDYPPGRPRAGKRIAVVGGGPAGMAFAVYAAERGHEVALYEAQAELGGQLRLACRVPGKREFESLLRYFRERLAELGVRVSLGCRVTPAQLRDGGFDDIVVASGVVPRVPALAGLDHPKVVFYPELLSGQRQAGRRVAILGAGGIGYDVAEFLLGDPADALDPARFRQYWGVDGSLRRAGGLAAEAAPAPPAREVHLLQRSPGAMGARLGKTTGWIHKSRLRRAGVRLMAGVGYRRIDDEGLHYVSEGAAGVLAVDTVVVCAGQEPDPTPALLSAAGVPMHVIGGAREARELDAARAMEEALQLAAVI